MKPSFAGITTNPLKREKKNSKGNNLHKECNWHLIDDPLGLRQVPPSTAHSSSPPPPLVEVLSFFVGSLSSSEINKGLLSWSISDFGEDLIIVCWMSIIEETNTTGFDEPIWLSEERWSGRNDFRERLRRIVFSKKRRGKIPSIETMFPTHLFLIRFRRIFVYVLWWIWFFQFVDEQLWVSKDEHDSKTWWRVSFILHLIGNSIDAKS